MESYLYTIVAKEKLQELLEAFHACLKLPIQVLDENGNVLERCGDPSTYCRHFIPYLPPNDSCQKLHATAGKRAMELGETYIFSCHAGLNHIVFPLINQEALFGSILVGPFLMENPDSLLITDLHHNYPDIPLESLLDLYDYAGQVTVIPPSMVTQVSRLLYHLFSNFVSDARQELIFNRGKIHQQSKINESIQMYKNLELDKKISYPFEKERELLTKVKTGNKQEASAILNDLLGYVFFSEGNSIEIIKSRASELCSLLSRSAIEGGAGTDQILKINNQFLKNLQTVKSIDALCYMLQEVLDIYMECMFSQLNTKNGDVVRKAMKYISENFASSLTLEDVADQVHLNPAYFSSIFKQACGSSFKEYLNMVRVEESKRLLANTDYSLINIAIATGFEDQSYFSKIFKKHTGLTPKQYRSH